MRSIELALLFNHLERPIITSNHITIIANVNSRSRSLTMLSPVRLSVVCLSVTLVHPTQAVEIFGISTAFGTLAIR